MSVSFSWLVADCPQCTVGFIQQRVFFIQKQVIFTLVNTLPQTLSEFKSQAQAFLSHFHCYISAHVFLKLPAIIISMLLLLKHPPQPLWDFFCKPCPCCSSAATEAGLLPPARLGPVPHEAPWGALQKHD